MNWSFFSIDQIKPRLISFGFLMLLIALASIAPILAANGNMDVYPIFQTVCHQIAERSFYIGNFPMAICARCSAIYFGIAVGSLFLPMITKDSRLFILGLLLFTSKLLLLDVLMDFFDVYHNYFPTRVTTGFLFGLSLAPFLISAVSELLPNRTTT